jgi:hypothetical protein
MRYIYFIYFLFGICPSFVSQTLDTIYLRTGRSEAEIDSVEKALSLAGVLPVVEKRETNLEFYKTQNLITEPGTLSGGYVTDFTFNSDPRLQKKPFVLNGDIILPITFGGKRWGLNSLQFIPQVKIRILRTDKSRGDSSLPVRTPSYLPTLVYYFSCKKWQQNINNRRRFYFGALKAFHHSNGQDGNEFDTLGNINTYNGNFSENAVFEVLFGKSKEFDYYKSKIENPASAMYYYKVGFEYHPDFLSNMDIGKYHIYGHNRVNIQFGLLFMKIYDEFVNNKEGTKTYQVAKNVIKERWRFVGNISYITDRTYNSGSNFNSLKSESLWSLKRINAYVTGFYVIPESVNAAAFVQVGYWGSDTYNMYFQQSIVHVRFGLAFAFFKYPKSGDLQKNVYGFSNY